MTRTQRIVWIIVLAFVIYAIVQYPGESADKVRWFWDELLDAFVAIGQFFGNVISG